MSKQLTEEAIENFSKIFKGGKEAATEMIERHGDIIKKETDKYGNIKYYFSGQEYLYYDFSMEEMALEEN
jgi:hypothetical protein